MTLERWQRAIGETVIVACMGSAEADVGRSLLAVRPDGASNLGREVKYGELCGTAKRVNKCPFWS